MKHFTKEQMQETINRINKALEMENLPLEVREAIKKQSEATRPSDGEKVNLTIIT